VKSKKLKKDQLMNFNLTQKLIIALTFGTFLISSFTVGCTGGYISYKKSKGTETEKPKVAKKDKKGGPPSHAPAHGYRAKRHYRYYPSHSVYYDTGRGLYFYLKGDSWEVGASLPGKLKVSLGDYVSLELDTDKPYIHHSEHVKKYPPGQLKKKKKPKKWAQQKK
jgi:hypothetical protein